MQKIKLPSGDVMLCCKTGLKKLKGYRLYKIKVSGNKIYVRAIKIKGGVKIERYAHRLIMNVSKFNIKIDHKNSNGLDNRIANLRVCNDSDNQKNKSGYGASSYKGVSRHYNSKWIARINTNGVQKHIGLFNTEREAALAYNREATKSGNKFFKLNLVI